MDYEDLRTSAFRASGGLSGKHGAFWTLESLNERGRKRERERERERETDREREREIEREGGRDRGGGLVREEQAPVRLGARLAPSPKERKPERKKERKEERKKEIRQKEIKKERKDEIQKEGKKDIKKERRKERWLGLSPAPPNPKL